MISIEDATGAIVALRICRYFPSDRFQQSQVAAILIEMVGSKDELDWLVHAQSKLDWQGPYQLRQLFASRFIPRDTLTEEEGERAYFEEQARETARKIEGWKREQKLLGEPPVRIDITPALNKLTRTEEGVRRQYRDKQVREYLERC